MWSGRTPAIGIVLPMALAVSACPEVATDLEGMGAVIYAVVTREPAKREEGKMEDRMKMNTKTKRIPASVVRSIASIIIAHPLMKCGRRLN